MSATVRPPAVMEGVDGEPVVLRAWCPRCAQEVLLHARTMKCIWCGTATTPADDARRKPGRAPTWTRATAIAAIQDFAREHGRPPTTAEARPSPPALRRLFGSFPAAIEAAGYERPTRGSHISRRGGGLPDRDSSRHIQGRPGARGAASGSVSGGGTRGRIATRLAGEQRASVPRRTPSCCPARRPRLAPSPPRHDPAGARPMRGPA